MSEAQKLLAEPLPSRAELVAAVIYIATVIGLLGGILWGWTV